MFEIYKQERIYNINLGSAYHIMKKEGFIAL